MFVEVTGKKIGRGGLFALPILKRDHEMVSLIVVDYY